MHLTTLQTQIFLYTLYLCPLFHSQRHLKPSQIMPGKISQTLWLQARSQWAQHQIPGPKGYRVQMCSLDEELVTTAWLDDFPVPDLLSPLSFPFP